MVSKLEWDSNFFKLNIGKAEIFSQTDLEELSAEKDRLKERYDLIYVFSSQINSLPFNNAFLMDRKVVYINECLFEAHFDEHVIEYKENSVNKELLNLALESGEYSRFRHDKCLPEGSYSSLYSSWIEQSVAHKIATNVFCYILEKKIRGLLTIDIKEEKGIIGLVATDSMCRGKGIGNSLMNSVINYAYLNGVKEIAVVTQEPNNAACHLYEKTGFVKRSCTNVWHWWLNKSDNPNSF